VDEANAAHTWVEAKLLSQLRQMLGSAVSRMHDVTSAVAKALRRFGVEDGVRTDPRLRELTVDYFNTFVRRALNARDVRAVFIIFDQYRIYATDLLDDDPELVLEIAYYFTYYGQVARDMGQPFVVDSTAHDLGHLVRAAWEMKSPVAPPLLEIFLGYVDAAELDRLHRELMAVRREKYWEVNERRMNMDYVPEPQRDRLREFLLSLR
jgi:hypothetical protein